MNENELETLLQSLTPACPSAALAKRVDDELKSDLSWARTSRGRVPTWLSPVLWASMGAAAAVLVMSGLHEPESMPPQVSQMTSIMPVSTIREVMNAENQGIQYNATSRLPEQHMKIVSMERHAWIDPRDGAQITVEMPREDSVVLPVSFQ
ncbi:MAG: hypothetical protein RL015_1445 [Verrucomicrobiota bacterium]|jgi:hypothetical protein